MTREEFIKGKEFRIVSREGKGEPSYSFTNTKNSHTPGFLNKHIKSEKDDHIIFSDFHLNVSEVNYNGFKGFTSVMDQIVRVEYLFENLVLIE